MTSYFGIEYFDRTTFCRERYLNGTCFPTWDQARREIQLIKKSDRRPHIIAHFGCIKRMKFKIIERKPRK